MAAYTTIDDPEAYFQVVTYTGNGSANNAITLPGDTDMQPDFVWIKNRDATDSHCLFDAVRGATNVMHSDTTAAEVTDTDTLDSFTSDGFQVDADVKVNTNTEKYVAWCWKANGSGSANTAGSINTIKTSANTTSGFSICNWTGTAANGTIGHGIGIVPEMVLVHRVSGGANNWRVTHKSVSATNEKVMVLNDNAAEYDDSGYFNDTAHTSTLVSLGSTTDTNFSGASMIAYCFAPVQGYSKFGLYTGNGNADGTFVYTGFRPAWVFFKENATADNWVCVDNKRNAFNPVKGRLRFDLSSDEDSPLEICDFLSNGFKLRSTLDEANTSGVTHIYGAFAEAPLVNSEGVPNNAR